MSALQVLHTAIARVCPIDGVAETGRIDFPAEATPEQRAAAQEVLRTIDLSPEAIARADRAELIAAAKAIVDRPNDPISLAMWAALEEVKEELRLAKSGKPKPSRTDAEVRAAVKVRLDGLLQQGS